MRRLLALVALIAGLVVLSAPASANECAPMGPDLSKFGIQHIEYCGPSPF